MSTIDKIMTLHDAAVAFACGASEKRHAARADLRAAIAELTAERDALFKAAESAVHDMEKARVWNGMDWYYNPLHPLHYRSALENLRAALDAARSKA